MFGWLKSHFFCFLLLIKATPKECVPLEYYKCVQFRYRVLIVYGKREGVKGYNTLLWNFTKYASELARIHPLADDPGICVVACALIGITLGAQRLKIGQIIPCHRAFAE
jgi:hypothetical protein